MCIDCGTRVKQEGNTELKRRWSVSPFAFNRVPLLCVIICLPFIGNIAETKSYNQRGTDWPTLEWVSGRGSEAICVSDSFAKYLPGETGNRVHVASCYELRKKRNKCKVNPIRALWTKWNIWRNTLDDPQADLDSWESSRAAVRGVSVSPVAELEFRVIFINFLFSSFLFAVNL